MLRYYLSLVFLVLVSSQGLRPFGVQPVVSATVAFLNTGTVAYAAAASYSGSFTIGSTGSNRVCFVPVGFGTANGLTITAISLGGSSILSNVAVGPIQNGTANAYIEVFYAINPPTGSQTLSITGSAGMGAIYTNVVCFTGVNQTTPVRAGTTNSATNTGASASLTITSDTSDLTMTALIPTQGVTSTNQTSDGLSNAGVWAFGSDHATTAASSVTHTWTIGNGQYVIAGFSIQHA